MSSGPISPVVKRKPVYEPGLDPHSIFSLWKRVLLAVLGSVCTFQLNSCAVFCFTHLYKTQLPYPNRLTRRRFVLQSP